MIEAIIFDMDGLLIDSEPLWHEAEIETANIVGIKMNKEQCFETTGLKSDKIIEHWYEKHKWKYPSQKKVEERLINKLISLVEKRGVEKAGAVNILEFFKKKRLKIALASSSQKIIINAVVKKLGIKKYFNAINSAEFEEYGKPHPAVYLKTAKLLKVNPVKCLAFEDSFNGLLAAKSARMKCVCVPDESIENSPKLAIADEVIPSLADFDNKTWKEINKI